MTQPGDADWWRSAVVYQVYPRSFSDHDGDGTGDILGIIDRLPYLAQLGIDAIWVSPWYPSPMADGGYDVSDYRDIHPDFGTLEQADTFIARAHDHGLRVLIDLVPTQQRPPSLVPGGARSKARFCRTRALHLPGRCWLRRQHPAEQLARNLGGVAWEPTTNPDGSRGQWYLTCSPLSSRIGTGRTLR